MAEYAFYEFVRGYPEFVASIDALEVRWRAGGEEVAADLLLKAYGQFRDELTVLAVTMSTAGTKILRESEKRTRVRGDTGGQGGDRLEDHLFVEPTKQQNLLPGSIGIANEDTLNANVGWWWTNEEGYTGLVGRKLFGYFYGGGEEPAAPSEELRGVHPLFQAGYTPVSGGGIITEPIPARRFIEKSIGPIDRAWKAEFDNIRNRYERNLAKAVEALA